MKYLKPRGTKDIYSKEVEVWQQIEKVCRRIFVGYNYKEIQTPIFESTDLFSRSIGKTTDIVAKEMYTFKDRKGRSLTLRPEETASVVRAVIENNLLVQENLIKLYYIGPMFRYERPQAGRFRQFNQVGVEVIGSKNPLVDAEIIILANKIFSGIGLEKLKVNLNTLGCQECQTEYKNKLNQYFKDKTKNMCKDCQNRYQENILRILDCKQEKCQKYINETPVLSDHLCSDCNQSFKMIQDCLSAQKVNYSINNRLVRGLDYYTGIVFEVVSDDLGAQNAVCGGGRYDKLINELGGPDVPACGFAIGVDRLSEIMISRNIGYGKKALKLFIANTGEQTKLKAFELMQAFRRIGISADMDYMDKSLKAQLKLADRLGAEKTLIVGEEELKNNLLILKNMKDGTQKEVICDVAEIAEKSL